MKLFAFLIRITDIELIRIRNSRIFIGREAETMSGFFFTPITRFYAEMMQGMGSTGSGVYAGNEADGSFFGTVQDKLSQMENGQGSFRMGFRNSGKRAESKKKEEGFWDKRARRRKMYMDLAQKAWYKHESERKYQESIDLHRRELSSARLQQWSLERATGEKVELDVNPSVLSEAATEFAQEYVFFKIPSALLNAKPKTSK